MFVLSFRLGDILGGFPSRRRQRLALLLCHLLLPRQAAQLGDGAAFYVGLTCHKQILERWPLKAFPRLIATSQAFFDRYGAASVFLARFTAVVRAFVPLIAGIVLAHPGLRLEVEGHTDSVGSDEFNQQLSEKRAASVRDFLVQQGISINSVTARGFGKTMPVASNDTAASRQLNRRV